MVRCNGKIFFLVVAGGCALAGCDEKKEPIETAALTEVGARRAGDGDKPSDDNQTTERIAMKIDAPPPWSNRLTKDSGFPCAVEKVLAASCRRCHWEPRENDAPFSLVKWEDTRKERQGTEIWKLMQKQVDADLMPPLEEMVDPPVAPLTPLQKKTLLDYLDAGAEKTVEACE